MHLLAHILLAFVAIGLQRGLDALLTVGAGRVDLVMIAASVTAVCLPKSSGPLAALLIGLAYDLSSAGPIGVYGAALGVGGLAASILSPTRWGRIVAGVIAGVVVATFVVRLLGLARGLVKQEDFGNTLSFAGVVNTILLTSLLGFALSWPLWKWRSALVVDGPRP